MDNMKQATDTMWDIVHQLTDVAVALVSEGRDGYHVAEAVMESRRQLMEAAFAAEDVIAATEGL